MNENEKYEGSMHICVKAVNGRTWYAVDSGCFHSSNVGPFTDWINPVNEQYGDLIELKILPYESRKIAPKKYCPWVD